MQLTDLLNRYGGVATYLGIDLVAIFLMTYVLYFRRHWRADLLLSYVALNIGIFVTMSVLTQVRIEIAVGFGLFAILSIIRLRSSAVTQQEVSYYFLALVLGLLNGLGVPDRGLVVALNVVLLLVMRALSSTGPDVPKVAFGTAIAPKPLRVHSAARRPSMLGRHRPAGQARA